MEVVCGNPLCAKIFEFRGGKVHFARTEKHRCSRKCKNTVHGMAGTPRHKIWEHAKKRARENDTIFRLTVYDIPDIPDACPILGIRLVANTKAGPLDSSPSLDRLIPSLGYVVGNIRIISNRANRLRSDSTARELWLLAEDAREIECQNSK
jgi:hypothetical protein